MCNLFLICLTSLSINAECAAESRLELIFLKSEYLIAHMSATATRACASKGLAQGRLRAARPPPYGPIGVLTCRDTTGTGCQSPASRGSTAGDQGCNFSDEK